MSGHVLPILLWLGCSGFTWPGRVAQLAYAVAHGEPSARIEALRLIEQYPSEPTSQALLSALEDADPEVRLQAARSAARLGVADAAPVLASWLTAPRAEHRRAALQALGQLGDARSLPGVERSLTDPDTEVRLAAVAAIGGYVARALAEPALLAPGLADADPRLRLAAVEALQVTEPPTPGKASGALAARLAERARDPDVEVRSAALRVLAQRERARSLPVLMHALEDPDERVRLTALAALGDCGVAAAVPALRARLSGPARTARTALAALGRIDDPAALGVLGAQLTRPELVHGATAALLARARRQATEATWSKALAAVSGALAQARDVGVQRPLLAALAELTQHAHDPGLAPLLLGKLREGSADTLLSTRALLAARTSELVPTLAQRVVSGGGADELLALELALREAPESAIDPALTANLSERLAHSTQQTRPQLYRLLALTHAEAPLAPRADDLAPGRREYAGLLGALPGTRERRQQLLGLLRDPDRDVSDAAASALAHSLDEVGVSELLDELTRAANVPLLSALAGALVHLSGGAQLPAALRERLYQQLALQLSAADLRIANAALYALRGLADPRAAPLVAQALRTGSASRRADAVLALGDFEVPEARQLLRFVLQNESPRSRVAASLALAEIASERDAEALLHAAERGSWPLPAAVSYTLARIAQRGVQKKRSFERILCRLGALQDSDVRANVAAGLAALQAEACDAQLSPEALLAPESPAVLRVAAAHWLRTSASASRQALASCSADADPAVAAACAEPSGEPPTPTRGKLLVQVLVAEAGAPWSERPVALQLPDGAVYVGRTDANGRVLLPRAVRGEVTATDPAD